MADEILSRDQNRVTVLGAVTNDADMDIVMLRVDPITKRLLVDATGLVGGVQSVTGTTNRITVDNTDPANPVVDIAATYAGQTSITTLGTITTGTWTGSTIGVGFGGTGTSTTFTAGSVVYAGAAGVYTQDNTNFRYDDSNDVLNIGTAMVGPTIGSGAFIGVKSINTFTCVFQGQNLSNGTAASTDAILYNDAGTDSVNYLDIGINSSTYTGAGILNGPGDAYFYNVSEDLVIATGTAGKNVIIGTGGFGGTAASKTRATFTDTGLQMMNGSAANPSISGTGATTTGFYWAATPAVNTAIAGVNRLTHSATTWSLNSSNGGAIDIGGTSQYMDMSGTIVASAATFQGLRTTNLIWDMQVNRTNSFGLNNANTIGGSTSGLTLTTMTGARSGNVATGTIGVAITTSNAFEAREFNNGSGGTVTVTNNFGFNASQNMTTGTAINAAFSGNNTASATRWNLYMSTTAQNWLAGNLGLGSGLSAPAAKLHIAAGSATAGTAQIKLDASTLLSTPENGAVEATSSHLYFTAGGVRYQLDQQAGGSGLSQAQVLTIASMRF